MCGIIQGPLLATSEPERRDSEAALCEIVIGIPHVLPAESRFLPSAQLWADTEACRQVLQRMALLVPDVYVYIGATDLNSPEVKVLSTSLCRPRPEVVARARGFAEFARSNVLKTIEQGRNVPAGIEIVRTLEVDSSKMPDRITEHRLRLKELSLAQSCELSSRGWTLEGDSASISLPPDALQREKMWLSSQEII